MTLLLPDEWSESDIRAWLLTLTSSGRSELPLPAGITLAAAVKTMFNRSRAEVRERLKRGAALALQEWRYTAHGYRALRELSAVAAVVGASTVIPRLAEIIRVECKFQRQDPERATTLSIATACLTGFAPAVDLDQRLKILFYDPDIDPTLGGLLFIALLKIRPDTLALHTPRFLKLRESVPGGFQHLGRALLDAIPPVMLITQFRQLSREAGAILAQLLELVHHPELVFGWSESGVDLYWTGQPTVKARIDVGSAERMADWYSEAMKQFTPENPNAGLLKWIKA